MDEGPTPRPKTSMNQRAGCLKTPILEPTKQARSPIEVLTQAQRVPLGLASLKFFLSARS